MIGYNLKQNKNKPNDKEKTNKLRKILVIKIDMVQYLI